MTLLTTSIINRRNFKTKVPFIALIALYVLESKTKLNDIKKYVKLKFFEIL